MFVNIHEDKTIIFVSISLKYKEILQQISFYKYYNSESVKAFNSY